MKSIHRRMQSNGIKIVPTVEWALYNELDWCLDGVPKNSSIAIGTYGSMKSLYNRYSLLKGMERIEKELHPTTVICYGSEIKSAHSIFKKIIFFENYCNTIKKRVK